MQTANVLVAIGGDSGNLVPKYGITAAETAVLRFIHGDDAVRDINIVGEVTRTHRQEIGRLTEAYGRQEGERRVSPAVNALFPGAAARVFETFDELEIPDELFVATSRKVVHDPLDHDGDGRPGGSLTDDKRAARGIDGMTLKQLQAHAGKIGCDLAGVTKKADVLEAIRTHEAQAESSEPDSPEGDDGEGDDGDGVGDIDDEHSESSMFK